MDCYMNEDYSNWLFFWVKRAPHGWGLKWLLVDLLPEVRVFYD